MIEIEKQFSKNYGLLCPTQHILFAHRLNYKSLPDSKSEIIEWENYFNSDAF